MRRRDFEKAGLAGGLGFLAGCPANPTAVRPVDLSVTCKAPPEGGEADYVVVGSGAGGGPLACNLARAGHSVVLLEAGGDPSSWTRDVPAFHAAAAEDPKMRWDFWVRTYSNEEQQRQNTRYAETKGGVLYPRAGTLGGCTAHNALITIYPHESDWDAIADAVGDESYRAVNMRRYFERLEHCDYASKPAAGKTSKSRHGFDGWLHTDVASLWLGLGDGLIAQIVEAAIEEASEMNPALFADAVRMVLSPSQSLWDPNDDRTVRAKGEGVVFVPLHMNRGARSGTREYVRAVEKACPNALKVELDALATRVLFDDDKRAVGVEYLKGANLYRACASPDPRPAGETRVVRAKREVILSGGTFNSPQLLMLSGIGSRDELARLGVPIVSALPGVGKNLQDRYEIGVVSEMASDFTVLEGARLKEPDPAIPDRAYERWQKHKTGPYSTNGVVCALIKKSLPKLAQPDLFLFGLVGNFKGYYPGYSGDLVADKRHFTWGVLKAHTHNRAGEVRLRSTNPRDPPEIDFHYFDEASGGADEDVNAVVEGVLTARKMMRWLGSKVVREVVPGPEVQTREDIARYVRDNAWGHHASCSNKMGPSTDPMAVVDGDFRVHGVKGLRVVDASVFPRIPGFFIVSAVYMLAEKATDVILATAIQMDNKGSSR